jgi:hypothetical protein
MASRFVVADPTTPAGGRHFDLFLLAVLLALFCLRVWDLGIVDRDDALWALHAWQGRWDIIWNWATGQGRVWALVSGPLLFVALKIKGTFIGNLAIAGTFAVFFLLFHWVVAVHFGRRIAVLAACLNLGLYAMRWEGSLITAYPAFTWILGSLYLLALLALNRYLATGNSRLLVASLALFFCSMFLHEGVTALFVLLYALAAAHHRRRHDLVEPAVSDAMLRKASWSALSGWITVVALYALVYFGWRLVFPSSYEGNVLARFDVIRIARVLLAFTLNGSILHDMFVAYTVRFGDSILWDATRVGYPFWEFVRHPRLHTGSLAAGALAGLLVWHTLARLRPTERHGDGRMQQAVTVIVGVLIAFIPIIPVAATPKYQGYYDLGIRAYVHTALSHFGVSLAVAAILIWAVDSLRRRNARLAVAGAMTCLIAVLSAGAYAMNDAIALDMRAEASRWLVFDRAIRIMRSQGWSRYNIVAPRFASGSWFAVLPAGFWVEWAAARYGTQVGFITTEVPAPALADRAIVLDFVAMGETGIFVTLAHLRTQDAHEPPIADAIFVAPVKVADYRMTQETLQFDDVKLGRRDIRLVSAERMPEDPSVRVIRSVAADPGSIKVLPQSPLGSLPIACATPLAPVDRVTFGTSAGPRQSTCIGTMLLGEGWHAPERTGVWSRARTAVLRLPVAVSAGDLRVRLTMSSYPGLGFYDSAMEVQIRAGGRLVAERHDEFRSRMAPIEFAVNRDDVTADGDLTITIGVDRTYNPRQLGIAPDDRDLGVHLEMLELLPRQDGK